MFKTALLATALVAPVAAFACPGSSTATVTASAEKDPAACAKKAELVGSNCSYSTSMMARQVLDDGRPYAFAGTLAPAPAALSSHVAAPYTIGPDGVRVVANELLDELVAAGADARFNLAALSGYLREGGDAGAVPGIKSTAVPGSPPGGLTIP